MIGPEDGTILEIRWTPELRAELERWLILEGQQPRPCDRDFTHYGSGKYLARCRGLTTRAIRILGRVLEHHAIKPLDADIAALRPPRPMPEPLTLPMPAQTTPP